MLDVCKLKKYLSVAREDVKDVLVGEAITQDELEMASVAVPADERPLLLIKTWGVVGESVTGFAKRFSLGGVGKMLGKAMEKTRMGTLLITDKKVYWERLREDTAASGITGIVGKINGNISHADIKQMSIGDHDHCLGSAYMGHQLVVNGAVIGLLRMGAGIEYNEEMIGFLNNLFAACID